MDLQTLKLDQGCAAASLHAPLRARAADFTVLGMFASFDFKRLQLLFRKALPLHLRLLIQEL